MKNREKRNAYMREYLPALKKRRHQWATQLLGGKCSRCGDVDGPFEFDHIDPSTKKEIIALMWRFSESNLLEELKKCQLLCSPCHRIKTCEDNGWEYSRGVHGLPGSHRYCSCEVCLSAWREYQRGRRRMNGIAPPKPREQKIKEIVHGTRAGYQAEKRHGLEHCKECQAANTAYTKELKARKSNSVLS